MDPHIVCIEKLTKDTSGEQMLHGCWFLRPKETYHVATRKFLEKELFRSDFNDTVSFDKVLGKCFVMHVKDYFKMKPEVWTDQNNNCLIYYINMHIFCNKLFLIIFLNVKSCIYRVSMRRTSMCVSPDTLAGIRLSRRSSRV